MTDPWLDIRMPLAASDEVCVEPGRDGTLHLVLPASTRHLDRTHCQQLTETSARALERLHVIDAARLSPGAQLRVVSSERQPTAACDHAHRQQRVARTPSRGE